jgi:hypothetical protein
MDGLIARLGRDGIAGTAIAIGGLIGFWIVRDYPVGSLAEFGPGFMPWVGTIGMAILGLAMVARALVGGGGEIVPVTVGRPVIVVPAGMAIFAFGLEPLGFMLASALAVFVTSLAAKESSVIERIAVSVGLAVLVTGIFGFGLKMTMPLAPWFLRS